jgi:hypothetical protein
MTREFDSARICSSLSSERPHSRGGAPHPPESPILKRESLDELEVVRSVSCTNFQMSSPARRDVVTPILLGLAALAERARRA